MRIARGANESAFGVVAIGRDRCRRRTAENLRGVETGGRVQIHKAPGDPDPSSLWRPRTIRGFYFEPTWRPMSSFMGVYVP